MFSMLLDTNKYELKAVMIGCVDNYNNKCITPKLKGLTPARQGVKPYHKLCFSVQLFGFRAEREMVFRLFSNNIFELELLSTNDGF